MRSTSDIYADHVVDLTRASEAGDRLAAASLACLALLVAGWRPGDADAADGESALQVVARRAAAETKNPLAAGAAGA